MRLSQLCLSPCPPTSAPQKQYPAFSTQMEVTPYASKPLSFCQGSRAWLDLTRTIPLPLYAILICTSHLSSFFIFFILFLKIFFGVSPVLHSVSPRSGRQRVPTCICSRCFGGVTFCILMHFLNKFPCKACHQVTKVI